jgi:murein DD-endopeptidase MepM/ murein hydrolase activator NlpD
MSEGVASTFRRNAYRFALTGIVGIWLSGCADATRFADSSNPFANPFSSASNDAAAPTPQIASTPLAAAKPYNTSYAAPARQSPTAVASSQTPTPSATGSIRSDIQPVGGSASGWTAVGGSPIVVGPSDDAAALSARYGVPEAALLAANGLHSRSEIHANMRIVVPVYNAHGDTRVAKAEGERDVKEKTRHGSKRKSDDQNAADAPKSKRAEAERKKHEAEADGEHKKLAKGDKSKKGEDSAKTEKAEPQTQVAKNEPAKTPKKPETDKTPTGDVSSGTSTEESSKLRWPARGRIILGFKQGGNDGINISLPEGTSVRAAEDGKVAYAGNALKGYGNLVLIRHTNGIVTAYANNGELDVKSGDTVKRGQVIAKSGQTGDVSSPQLHFEVRKGQTPVDPTNFLAGL